jgi:hypothetical protein
MVVNVMDFELVFGLVDPELVWMRVLSCVPIFVPTFVVGRIWWAAWNVGKRR